MTTALAPAPVTAEDSRPTVETVVVVGDLDLGSAAQVRRSLEDVFSLRPDQLVVDLSACGFVDPAGLRVLLEARRRCRRRGSELVLRGVQQGCHRLLAVTRTLGLFRLV